MGPAVGGLYWFFVTFLPGYVSFRFPAKLFVVASLFLCLIAARELQARWNEDRLQTLVRPIRFFLLFHTLVLMGIWMGSMPINRAFFTFESRSEFGPFSIEHGWESICGGVIQAIAVCLGCLAVLKVRSRTTILIGLVVIGLGDPFGRRERLCDGFLLCGQ